jgi:hypothetical protein
VLCHEVHCEATGNITCSFKGYNVLLQVKSVTCLTVVRKVFTSRLQAEVSSKIHCIIP